MAERYAVDELHGGEWWIRRDGLLWVCFGDAQGQAQEVVASLNAADELEDALRPFAAMAEKIDATTRDAAGMGLVGELRRAAEAIERHGRGRE